MIDSQQDRQAAEWAARLTGAPVGEVLRWSVATFGSDIAFATSLGLEDQALTDLIASHTPDLRIFTLDTGRLFPETYDLLVRTERQYGIKIKIFFPVAEDVELLVNEHGLDAYRQSVELRKECCRVRKVVPLRRALTGLAAWVCGLRREQSVTRRDLAPVEWDGALGLYKINPLIEWSEEQLQTYVREHKVPYHVLHDQGFPSIGCACCTRAVVPGEDVRAGRWWWENPEHKECGLHLRPKVER